MALPLDQSKKPGISLCMIAKNEEHLIGNAIKSVSEIVSEIIVVDTGSTDNTKQIAKELGAIVIDFIWEDDFSKPRNISLDKASHEWILVLDCDEEISSKDHNTIVEFTKDKNCCYLLPQRHYSNDQRISNYYPCKNEYLEEKDHMGFFVSYCCRLFPNRSDVRFEGRIHELVEHSIKRTSLKLLTSKIPIHHYGHTEEAKLRKDKSKLYTTLGSRKTDEQPNDWKAFFELGVEHNNNGRKKESIENFKKSLSINKQHVPSWSNLGYVLMESGKLEDAHFALTQALKLDKNYPDAHCNISVVYMRANKFDMAIKHLSYVTSIKTDYVNAYNNLADCYLHLNQADKAHDVLKNVLKLSPNNYQAKLKLASCFMVTKKYENAKPILEELKEKEENFPETHYYLGKLSVAENNIEQAIKSLNKFLELIEKRVDKNSLQFKNLVKKEIQELESVR